MSKSYSEKLRDPRWQKKRLEIMQRDGFACRRCKDTTKTLNVHHLSYVHGYEPWDYPPEMLVTLCEDCHERNHNIKQPEQGKVVEVFPLTKVGDEAFFGYIVGLGCNVSTTGDEFPPNYYALFDYNGERTVQFLPHEPQLFCKLAGHLIDNMATSDAGGIIGKVWIRKTAAGWEVDLP